MRKKALITGITGQDGSYLAEFLLEKDYEVFGLVRRLSVPNTKNITQILDKVKLEDGDLTDQNSLLNVINKIKPDEVYNLAAQSFVPSSFNQPVLTAEINTIGVVKLLDSIKAVSPKTKFYQAATSEMFGKVKETPQNEETPFHPRSPYGIAKLGAYWFVRNYRESYGMFNCNGILFNHESPRRGLEFVTRKITRKVAGIKLGKEKELRLGNLDAKRDWGYAGDYCMNLDVPILTNKGWKFYNEIKEGTTLINFNPKTNKITNDKVLKKIILDSKGDKIILRGRGIYLCVTPNHRLYYQQKSRKSKGGWSNWKVIIAKKVYELFKNKSIRTKYDYRFPHFQNYDGRDYSILDSKIYLLGALLAEGCLSEIEPGRGIRVSLSQSFIKNKKVYDKIQNCVDELNLKYRIRKRNDGVVEWVFNSNSSKIILDLFDKPDIHIVPKYVWKFSQRQFEALFNALMDCDGHWGSLTFISSRYKLATDFQTIAHLAGYRTSKIKERKDSKIYCVYVISKRKKYTYIQEAEKINDGKKRVWCVNTNNGTIITRDNDCISISGNCEAMWLMLQQDKPDDYVIATGETHSIKEFVDLAFNFAKLKYKIVDLHELSCDKADEKVKELQKQKDEIFVVQHPRFFRPAEVDLLMGDAAKAKEKLGWEPKVKFQELIKIMVDYDLKQTEDYRGKIK